MIVAIAGMPRSGSTFSFNVARKILMARGSVYQEPQNDVVGAVCRSEGADHVLVKSHKLDEPSLALARAGAMRIVMTVRRVEDAMASWLEAFDAVPETVALEIMRDWLTMFRQLRSLALIVPYEQSDRRPWLAAWRIARAICPTAYPPEVLAITRQFNKSAMKRYADSLAPSDPGVFDAGFSYYDTETFFHRRHISSRLSRPAEQRLSSDRLLAIRSALAAEIVAADLPLIG